MSGIVISPLPGLARPFALAGVLALFTAFSLAGPPPAPPGQRPPASKAPAAVEAWDCWIDAADGGGIRCIADRDRPPTQPGDCSDDDEAAEVLLELVHDYLHRGIPGRASELVREESHLLRRDDLWTIRLHAPPLDSSWRDARPAQLVRSLLCRGQSTCAIRFHR